MLSHPALCCRKETYSSASSDCSTDSKKRSQSLNSLDIQSRCQDAQSRTFAGWGWGASATGGHPQLESVNDSQEAEEPQEWSAAGSCSRDRYMEQRSHCGKTPVGGAPLSVLLFREEDVHKRASSMQQVSYLTTRGWKEGHANAATPEYQCTQRATLRSAPMSTRTPVVCTSPEALRGCACGVRCGLCGPSRGRHSC